MTLILNYHLHCVTKQYRVKNKIYYLLKIINIFVYNIIYTLGNYMDWLYGGVSPKCFHVFKQSFFGVYGTGLANAD